MAAPGWVAVTLGPLITGLVGPGRPAGPDAAAALARAGRADGPLAAGVTVAGTLDRLPLAAVTGIDMPLGLLGAGWRDADLLARRALGRRGVTVFAIPPRAVWEHRPTPRRTALPRTGRQGAFRAGLGPAPQDRRGRPVPPRHRDGDRRGTAVEVHPELSFAALAGAPLPDSKHTPTGLAVRRDLLAEQASPCR